MNKIANWFEALTARERWIVGVGVPLALVALIYFIGIEPLQKKRDKVHARINTAHEQLAEMQTLASSLQFVEKRRDANEVFGADLDKVTNEQMMSKPLDEAQAKQLFVRLAQIGHTTLKRTSDGRWTVWLEK